ncbi:MULTISPECIES: AMP-binding protein [unclassified Corynebacterium]|uniref:AMP-binding protein n=1 Tax=unclassified Corynebacterium TaxID=2624378 RepID=UPI0029CA2A6A|nr:MULTISPECIES: AMP-binding protein [unclassified Corynebacterium]WPF65614.1 AMP-binding protein [Corynebacterium sp. 22KM0430]WPF68109.1 AMP-binding protein [Corynebacterium sp. 21KM1197]
MSLPTPPSRSLYDRIFADLSPSDAQRPAITEVDSGQHITYGELRTRIDAFAGYLAARGIGPGDVVAVQLPSSIDFAVAFYGVLRAGATATPMGMLLNEKDTMNIVANSGAVLLLSALDHSAAPTEALFLPASALPGIYRDALPAPDISLDPDRTLACIPFSSGTTGAPKGVKLSHRNLVSNIFQVREAIEALGLNSDARVLAPLPFSHIYGLTILLAIPLVQRAHIFTMARFDLPLFLRSHEEHCITFTFIAPPIAVALAKHPSVAEVDMSSLRVLISAAASLDSQLALAVEERLDARVIQGYGMTEASPIVTLGDFDTADRGSIGYPLPLTECRLVNPETLEDHPTRGELLIRGPQVMQGYLNNPEATAATILPEGWLRTGDIVEKGESGELYVVDRAKEVIKYKGYQVAPSELEALLLTRSDIDDAAVVGAYREGLEIPRAFVVPAPGCLLDPEEIMAWVAERVTPYKKIRHVDVVKSVPKSATGKILRRELREVPLAA